IVECQSGTLAISVYTQTAGQTIMSGGNFGTNGTTWNLNGGILRGTGTITGNVTNAANVSPGLSPGTITIVGNYVQTAAGTLTIEITGLTAGTQYDQLVVNGTVTLGGNLSLNASFTPPSGSQFIIASNDLTDPVTGTFAGAPEGQVFTTPGGNFRITYHGGTGNDVVLTPLLQTAYNTVPPCRVADTRGAVGPYGGPALAANLDRSFTIPGQCGLPPTAPRASSPFHLLPP